MTVSPVTIPNPLKALVDFIGSANVQKALAGVQIGISGATGAEGKTLGAHIAGMSIGAGYGIAVHTIDAVRAWISTVFEHKPAGVVVPVPAPAAEVAA